MWMAPSCGGILQLLNDFSLLASIQRQAHPLMLRLLNMVRTDAALSSSPSSFMASRNSIASSRPL